MHTRSRAERLHLLLASVFAGFHVTEWLMLPATVVWLVGCSNAFNLTDGRDGLAAGVGLFATVTTLLAALLNGQVELAFAIVPLMGPLGFLRLTSIRLPFFGRLRQSAH